MTPQTAYRVHLILLSACLRLAAGAGSSFAAVRFEVAGAPTEVLNTGRSEVVGTVNFFVRGTGNVTGTSAGGATQIGLVFANPALQIDNTAASGIRLFWSAGFAAANPSIVALENRELGDQCTGFLAINLLPGATPAEGEFIRLEGIRARIDTSRAITPGTDLYVDLQSVNDPSANYFWPDRIRVAKSLKGMRAKALSDDLTYRIVISEAFERAFVDSDSNNDGANFNDRVDTGGNALGSPTNSTRILLRMDGIPEGVSGVVWPPTSTVFSTGACLQLVSSASDLPTSTAVYSYESVNQVSSSDVAVESFTISPLFLFGGGRCDTAELSTAVTLVPTAEATTGCSSPSASVQRPRFLEVYELSLSGFSPSSAVAGGSSFTLNICGTGFVAGSQVLWNRTPRNTTFTSNSRLAAEIREADIAKAGTASIAVSNPAAIGGEISEALVFQVAPPALALFCPRLVSQESPSTSPGNSEYTAIALTNPSGRVANLKLTAFDAQGQKIQGSGISNPATLKLKSAEQLALIDAELFGPGYGKVGRVGWLKVEGDVPEVVGLFLSFNAGLSRLDGADLSSAAATSFVFPLIEPQGYTQLHIANPNDDPAAVLIELARSDGILRAEAVGRIIPGNGVLAESVSELFPGINQESSDYVRVRSNRDLVPFEYFGRVPWDSAGLSGRDTNSGAGTLYSPQYVVGSDWRSVLSIVNLSANEGDVRLRFIGDNGALIGSERVLPVAARGKILIADQEFFGDGGSSLRQGYLEITTSGITITGAVVFSKPELNRLLTALPLVSKLEARMLFGQVASNTTFFTGLSVLNPNDEAATVILQIFDSNGNQLASKLETIPAMGRMSGLLTQYFPRLAEQDIRSGYIVLTSGRKLAAFSAYGTNNLTVLSAIPAQIPYRQ